MISKWRWLLKQFLEKLWVIAVFYAALGLVTVALAGVIGPLLPTGIGEKLGSGATQTVLTILASSLLSVVTFSLGIMVSAFSGAAQAVTPRATPLLQSDKTTQRVLATFLGAFLFSLIGIIALQTGAYTPNDELVLFSVAIVVVIIVTIAIFRWIAHLSVFGLMSDSISKVEAATINALEVRLAAPYLGGHALTGAPPQDAVAVYARQIGYIRHIDMHALQAAAEPAKARVFLAAHPGSFVHPGTPLMWVAGGGDCEEALRDACSVGTSRSFDQDPRFGLAVLTEIAARALSPAVNDPGTAIDILGRTVRVLSIWAKPRHPDLKFPRVRVPPLRLADVMDDVFPAIARDGATNFAVQMRLQKSLLALSELSPDTFAETALFQSTQAMQRCQTHMLPDEYKNLQHICDRISALAGPQSPKRSKG